jgi:hypothetical protein
MSIELQDDAVIRAFITAAEEVIVKGCTFLGHLSPGSGLSIHESFLRKLPAIQHASNGQSCSQPTTIYVLKLQRERPALQRQKGACACGAVLVRRFARTR